MNNESDLLDGRADFEAWRAIAKCDSEELTKREAAAPYKKE